MWHTMKRISTCWNSNINVVRFARQWKLSVRERSIFELRSKSGDKGEKVNKLRVHRCRVRHVRPSHIHKCFEERWFYCTISLRILRWQENENYLQSNRKFKFKSVKNKSVILRLQMQLSRSQIYGRNGILDFSLTLYWNSAIRLGRNSSNKKKELE